MHGFNGLCENGNLDSPLLQRGCRVCSLRRRRLSMHPATASLLAQRSLATSCCRGRSSGLALCLTTTRKQRSFSDLRESENATRRPRVSEEQIVRTGAISIVQKAHPCCLPHRHELVHGTGGLAGAYLSTTDFRQVLRLSMKSLTRGGLANVKQLRLQSRTSVAYVARRCMRL